MNKESKILAGLGIATVILIVVGSFFFTKPSTPKEVDTRPADASLLVRDGAYKLGNDDAPVRIVEFGDYQCPACAVADPVLKKVLADYEGKVQFVFRHFPLPMHANGQISSMAAEAAGTQGKYWEMHEKLYSRQADWAEEKNPMDVFVKFAQEIGLNVDDFKKAVESKSYQATIDSGMTDGNALGVNSTPTFYIQGIKRVGVLSENEFKQYIDEALAQSGN